MAIYNENYTGFVYLWYDRKWFCIGSHMGSLEDGYTSSTGFMNKAYKKDRMILREEYCIFMKARIIKNCWNMSKDF